MSMWWRLQLRREAGSVPLARRLLLQALETEGVDREIAHELSVALTEACANAVEHGVGEHSPVFRVTAWLDAERCRIEVADSGPGFPRSFRAPQGSAADAETAGEAGRGLFMIGALTDSFHVGNRPGGGGAVIRFEKLLVRPDDASGEEAGAGDRREPVLVHAG